jgi:hypothetical protein
MEAAATCFGLQRNHDQGATANTKLKITCLVQCEYRHPADSVSVMAP